MNNLAKNLMAAFGVFCILMVLPVSVIADTPTDLQPVAVIPDPIKEFSPVIEGEIVTRDYVVRNLGTAALKIIELQTS